MEVSPESDSPPPASNSFKALLAFYSNYLHSRLRAFSPLSAISVDSSLLRRIGNLYGTTRRRSRKTCLPLPLPSVASITYLDRASTYDFYCLIGQSDDVLLFFFVSRYSLAFSSCCAIFFFFFCGKFCAIRAITVVLMEKHIMLY